MFSPKVAQALVYREVKLLKMHEARLDLMLYFAVCVLLEQV